MMMVTRTIFVLSTFLSLLACASVCASFRSDPRAGDEMMGVAPFARLSNTSTDRPFVSRTLDIDRSLCTNALLLPPLTDVRATADGLSGWPAYSSVRPYRCRPGHRCPDLLSSKPRASPPRPQAIAPPPMRTMTSRRSFPFKTPSLFCYGILTATRVN